MEAPASAQMEASRIQVNRLMEHLPANFPTILAVRRRYGGSGGFLVISQDTGDLSQTYLTAHGKNYYRIFTHRLTDGHFILGDEINFYGPFVRMGRNVLLEDSNFHIFLSSQTMLPTLVPGEWALVTRVKVFRSNFELLTENEFEGLVEFRKGADWTIRPNLLGLQEAGAPVTEEQVEQAEDMWEAAGVLAVPDVELMALSNV